MFRKIPKASLFSIGKIPNQESLYQSEFFWVRTAKETIKEVVEQGKYQGLSPKITDDGIIIVGNRIEKCLEVSYNSKQIMLLPNDHKLTKLHATYTHEQGQLGVAVPISKIRLKFWVIRLKVIVKSTVNKCQVQDTHETNTVANNGTVTNRKANSSTSI